MTSFESLPLNMLLLLRNLLHRRDRDGGQTVSPPPRLRPQHSPASGLTAQWCRQVSSWQISIPGCALSSCSAAAGSVQRLEGMTSTSQALFSCVRQTLPAPSFCPSICPLFTWEKPGPQNSGPDMSPASHDVEDKAGGSWDGMGKRKEQTMWKFGCCHLPLPISPCPTSSPKRQCHCPAPCPGKGDFLCKALGPFLHLFLFPFPHLFLSSPLPPFPFPLVLASSILLPRSLY